MAFFEALGNWLWGGPLLAAFLIVGLWYSLSLIHISEPTRRP